MVMTSQQTFDKVANHLRKQGVQAYEHGVGCCYRHELPNGTVRTCAVGCLLPKAQYRKRFETNAVFRLLQGSLSYRGKYLRVPKALVGLDPGLLMDLQDLHDDPNHWDDPGGFNDDGERNLEAMAATFELTYTPPKES